MSCQAAGRTIRRWLPSVCGLTDSYLALLLSGASALPAVLSRTSPGQEFHQAGCVGVSTPKLFTAPQALTLHSPRKWQTAAPAAWLAREPVSTVDNIGF